MRIELILMCNKNLLAQVYIASSVGGKKILDEWWLEGKAVRYGQLYFIYPVQVFSVASRGSF